MAATPAGPMLKLITCPGKMKGCMLRFTNGRGEEDSYPRRLHCHDWLCKKCLDYLANDEKSSRKSNLGTKCYPCPTCGSLSVPGSEQPCAFMAYLVNVIDQLKEGCGNQTAMCPQHPNDPLEYYCGNHTITTCQQSKDNEHKNCSDIHKLDDDFREKVAIECTKLQDQLKELKELLDNLQKQQRKRTCDCDGRKLDESLRNAEIMHNIQTHVENNHKTTVTAQWLRSKEEEFKDHLSTKISKVVTDRIEQETKYKIRKIDWLIDVLEICNSNTTGLVMRRISDEFVLKSLDFMRLRDIFGKDKTRAKEAKEKFVGDHGEEYLEEEYQKLTKIQIDIELLNFLIVCKSPTTSVNVQVTAGLNNLGLDEDNSMS